MKYKHLFWGIILISIGVLIILANLGIIHFNWFSFWRLWPVIFILWGISILPIKDLYRFILLISIVIITFFIINRLPETRPFGHWHQDGNSFYFGPFDDEDDAGSANFREQNLTVPFDSLSTKGILKLEAAAGSFRIDSVAKEYLSFKKTGNIGNYELTTNDRGKIKEISLSMQKGGAHHRVEKNLIDIHLNQKPTWNLNLDLGAASMVLDLSKYKIDTAEIDAGAASVDITLGNLNPAVYLKIDAGASSFTINVPKDAGCRIKSDSFLISKDFEGFDKKEDRTYETSNWNSSGSKINIRIETAVSTIKINRY